MPFFSNYLSLWDLGNFRIVDLGLRFEKYKLHFSPTLGKPPRDHSKVWGTMFHSPWKDLELLYARESCLHEAFLYLAGFTFYNIVFTWPPLYLWAQGFLSACLNEPKCPLLHARVCSIYVCRIAPCLRIYKQSKVKTISSESSFVFDGPV